MNFIDHRLSLNVSDGFRRITTGSTQIVTLDQGDEVRNACWKYPKLKYAATFHHLPDKAQKELTNAFYAARARLYLFRFHDLGDYLAEQEPLEITPGTREPVQLTKTYPFGSARGQRQIQAIDHCVVKDAHGTVVDGVIDTALGLFTPKELWGDGKYFWDGRFDVWVRFGSDELDTTLVAQDLEVSDVELWEMRARR